MIGIKGTEAAWTLGPCLVFDQRLREAGSRSSLQDAAQIFQACRHQDHECEQDEEDEFFPDISQPVNFQQDEAMNGTDQAGRECMTEA